MSYSKNLPKPVRAATVLIVPVHTHTCVETGEFINSGGAVATLFLHGGSGNQRRQRQRGY